MFFVAFKMAFMRWEYRYSDIAIAIAIAIEIAMVIEYGDINNIILPFALCK